MQKVNLKNFQMDTVSFDSNNCAMDTCDSKAWFCKFYVCISLNCEAVFTLKKQNKNMLM